MPRPDLLALTLDDLAALTNRGTVKRAQRELDEGEVTGTVAEADDGGIQVRWSDGVECRIGVGAALAEGRCTCAAVGLCRHLLRTVIAYQRRAAEAPGLGRGDKPPGSSAPTPPWDPGAIPDEELAKHYRPTLFSKLKGEFNRGVLAEVVRSAKPTARFHQPAAVVRFLVPGDPRYTHCDCADPAPCPHVPLAVWAFRRLPADVPAGIISTSGKAAPVAAGLLAEIDAVMAEFAEVGLSGATTQWADRLARLEPRCRSAGLVWPAEVVADLVEQQHRYAGHDALFAPDRVPELVGELLARRDAIAADTGELPQPLIRGTGSDSSGSLGKCRLVGLGCGVVVGRREAELVAYLQDADTGAVAVVAREFADPPPNQQPRPFAELARFPAVKSVPFADLGRGQLLTDGGRWTAGFRLLLGRTHASVQPQAYAWESLRPPTLVEDYAELAARLAGLPPSALRPRRAAEDFHVLPVAAVEAAGFDVPSQSVVATLRDAQGQAAYLSHPFTTRGRPGTEALLAKLHDAESKLKFVAGVVRRTPHGLVVHPVGCVFETPTGRTAVQPWVDDAPAPAAAAQEVVAAPPAAHPVADVGRRLAAALEDVFTLGLRRTDDLTARRWRELHRAAESVGLARLGARVGVIADELERKPHAVRWDPRPAAAAVLGLAVLARLARDVGLGGEVAGW